MTRVKFFFVTNWGDIQKEVNDWLVSNPDIRIRHVAFQTSPPNNIIVMMVYNL
jgi:hypothetical protein